jgi:hypothetical protein
VRLCQSQRPAELPRTLRTCKEKFFRKSARARQHTQAGRATRPAQPTDRGVPGWRGYCK